METFLLVQLYDFVCLKRREDRALHHAGVEDLGSTPQQGGPCLEEKINSEEWSPGVIQAKTWFYQGSD